MPIKEALFWFGITVFGTGLFFWVEDGGRLPFAILLTVIGLIAAGYSVYAHHKPEANKVPLWVGLLLLTWAGLGYDYYDRHSPGKIVEFEQQDPPMTLHWAREIDSCTLIANGRAFLPRQSEYKLAIGCFIWDGTQDMIDAPNVQVSNLYDIQDGSILMRATWGDAYDKYLNEHGARGIQIALLLVPNGVQISQFTTLRQARSFGAKILQVLAVRT